MRALVLTGNGDAAPHGRSDELGTTLFGRCAPAGASSATLDLQPVTLGVRFASDVAGTVRAVRFFRGVAEGFPEDGFPVAIYDEAGRTIATGVATRGENPASGWLTAPLDRELRIEAGRSYVAAYHAPSGRYAYEYGGLASGVSAPPLSGAPDAGVFVYGQSIAFPTETFRSSNYFVDIQFAPARNCGRYTVTDLGVLPGGTVSEGQSLDGLTVVGTSQVMQAGGPNRAFVWTASSGLRDLGTLGGSWSFARAVSSGRVVGVAQTREGRGHGFLASTESSMVDLGTLGAAGALDISEARGVNSSGVVVGVSRTALGYERAVRWVDGVIEDLGTLAGIPQSNSAAYAINGRGQIVGSSDGNGGNRAALWEGGAWRALGTISGAPSVAVAVNDVGVAVGYALVQGRYRAVRYEGDGVEDLGTLPGFDSGTYANGIASDGTVVGTAVQRRGEGALVHGFVYRGQVMVDLNTVLETTGVEVNRATGIDAAGAIVGTGTSADGGERAVLLTPVCAP